jgi:chromosome partitioning protein
MKVIAVLNQKGGSGKTTISTHLARSLQISGYKVILVDSDSQLSASNWAAVNEEHPLLVVGIQRPTLDRDVKQLPNVDFVVIDGSPRLQEMSISALKAADLALIPVQPSPYDVWSATDMVKLVKDRIEITNGALKAAFVISRAIVGTKIGREISEALSGLELPVLESKISQRIIFSNSASLGSTAMDQDKTSEAAKEIDKLTEEVLKILEVSQHDKN